MLVCLKAGLMRTLKTKGSMDMNLLYSSLKDNYNFQFEVDILEEAINDLIVARMIARDQYRNHVFKLVV